MRKLITLTTCTALLAISASSLAITWPWNKKKNEESNTTSQQAVEKKASPKETTIALYASPKDSANVVKQIPVNTDLVAIYRQDGWVKVGDRKDGTTGWINLKQYRQAKQNYYQSFFHRDIESIYFHTEKGKDGKTTIVGYRNGKKLSKEEAQKIYHHMQQQQEAQWRQVKRFDRMMDRMMMNTYEAFPQPVVLMPGVVIIDHDAKSNKQAPPKKAPEEKPTSEEQKTSN